MASTSRLLLLRRGDHDSRLTEGFESLLDKESMTDVSITCGQNIVKAHRTVLSIFSPFFKRVFDSIQNPLHYPFIVLKDMPYADLRAIIDLMYRGEVTVTQDRFPSLKMSAKTLEVKELSDIITSYEEKNDIKPIAAGGGDDNGSAGRYTRKRGRPRRYGDFDNSDVDDTKPVFTTTGPPTKRQQVLLSKSAVQVRGHTHQDITHTIVTGLAKPQTAIRGGLKQTAAKSTTARGGITFSKPQIATRGGVTKAPPAGRGRAYQRAIIERDTDPNDEDYDPHMDTAWGSRRGGSRRGRRPRLSNDYPLATSLPLSVPQPMQIDLRNIFPDTSQSTAYPDQTVIKLELDSDSDVECIMSATSPLPSGVPDETHEEIPIVDSAPVDQPSTHLVPNDEPMPAIDANIDQTDTSEPLVDPSQGVPDLDSIVVDPSHGVPEIDPNVVIKTERPDTPPSSDNPFSDLLRSMAAEVIQTADDEGIPVGDPTTSDSGLQPQVTANENSNQSVEQLRRDTTSESIVDTSAPELLPLDPNIVVKQERPNTPPPEDDPLQSLLDEFQQESYGESADHSLPQLDTIPTPVAAQPQRQWQPTPTTTATQIPRVVMSAPTVITLSGNNETISAPIIRFIKTERLSPPPTSTQQTLSQSTLPTSAVTTPLETNQQITETQICMTHDMQPTITSSALDSVIDINEYIDASDGPPSAHVTNHYS